jgi:tripartite-type tricarboxylate transporter receptor subunit TctC
VSSTTDIRTPAELLNESAGIRLMRVPYKGASLAVTDTVGGTIDAMFAVNSTFGPQVRGGRMRAIAITSLQPSPAFPGLPTVASVVPGYNVTLWTGVFVPAGTPAAVVQRLNREINEAMKTKEMQDILNNDGGTALALTPEESAQRVRDSYATWKRVATARKIVLE